MEYNIIHSEDLQALIHAVNLADKDNWIPLGGITSTSETVQVPHPMSEYERMDLIQNTFYQAMTRTRKPNKVTRKKASVDSMEVVDLYNDLFKLEKVALKRAPIPALLHRIDRLTLDHFNTLEDWTKFFVSLKLSPFLMGNIPPGQGFKQFKLKLEWIINPTNLAKIIDRHFHGE